MEQSIHDYLDEIDVIVEEAERDADKILKAIDMDELLKDPEGYMLALADAFLERHVGNIKKASDSGVRHANKMMSLM